MSTRRDFLKSAAMLTGLAGASGVVPASVQRAFAIEPTPGSTYLDAEHIVIVMQENRSFDHALGSLQGVRGFNDPRAIRQANGNSIFVQTDAAGESFAPWRLNIKDTKITWMGSISHERQTQVDAWNFGHHNGWIDAKRPHNVDYKDVPMTMGHYTREDLPFYYALADAFTVCDQNYCGVMTSTTPNRSVFWTGTIRDQQNTTTSKVYIRNPELSVGGMTWKTYPERLHEAGIDWKFYQNELSHTSGISPEERQWLSNFGCNILEMFAAYNVNFTKANAADLKGRVDAQQAQVDKLLQQKSNAKGNTDKLDEKITTEQKKLAELKRSLELYNKGGLAALGATAQGLHERAFVTNVNDPHYRSLETISFDDEGGKKGTMKVPKGDIFHQFRADVDSGKLPTVSWLAPPEKFSDHPTSPWYGAWYVSEIVDILTKNPEVWKKTILILTYDENDGYFDHCATYAAPDPKRRETGRASEGIDTGLEYTYAVDEERQGVPMKQQRSGPIGLGYRVPMIIASPWTRGGWVNSQVYDHSSTLQFLESFIQAKYGKKVEETQISAFRRTICGNLTSAFRPYEAKKDELSFLNRDKFVAQIQRARDKEIPTNFVNLNAEQIAAINEKGALSGLMSQQEEGIRPSNALPYELYVDGAQVGANFELKMTAGNAVHGAKSQGAPFNVYLRNTKVDSPAAKFGPKGKSNMFAATYIVKAGDTLRQAFPLALFVDGNYEIDVVGPNGFWRTFKGSSKPNGLMLRAEYEGGAKPTGNVAVKLRNSTQAPMTVEVSDNSYKTGTVKRTLAPSAEDTVVLNLAKQHNWYDFTVKTDSSDAIAHYAGRVETGRHSFSDPLMGRAV